MFKEADLSPLEEQRGWLQDKMLGIGSFATEHNIPFLTALDDPYYTGNVARNLTFASEFIPGFGDIQGAREGEYMRTHGQPLFGAAMMGLSMLPFVPFTPIKKALERGLKTTPTKVVRTNTGNQAVSAALKDVEYSEWNAYEGNYYQDVYDLPRESRINYETNAERQLLSNPDFADPTKSYSVDDFINSTVANSPKEIRTTVRNQLDEWVSPDLRGSKVTTQELLDDIGKNKPTIQENYMTDTANLGSFYNSQFSQRSQYMPNIPTNDPNPNPLTALQTIHPDRYTERSFSIHSPNQGKIFEEPGHTEVGVGTALQEWTYGDFLQNSQNSTNRIFTTRAGIYDIDGVQTYIAAEGQSGIYGMGTSSKKALAAVGTSNKAMLDRYIIEPDVIESIVGAGDIIEDVPKYLNNPHPIDVVDHFNQTVDFEIPKNLPSSEAFLESLDEAGHTLDDWTDLAKERQNFLNKKAEAIQAQAKRDSGVWDVEGRFHAGKGQELEEALLLAREEANEKYVPQFNLMLGRSANLPSSAPLFKEWFPLYMKTSLNDAVEHGADVVRFPINAESVAKQTGYPLVPARAKPFANEYTEELGETRRFNRYTPNEKSDRIGKIYKKRTDEGIKRVEAEYGIKLNPTEIVDDNNNRFLEIVLTPELKEAFETIVYNRGGAVYKKPLMHLRY